MSEDDIRQEAIEATEKHYKAIIDEQTEIIKKFKEDLSKYKNK
jgi:hypothetical protein